MTEIPFLQTTIAGIVALALEQGFKIFPRQNLALYTSGPFHASPYVHLAGGPPDDICCELRRTSSYKNAPGIGSTTLQSLADKWSHW